MFSKIVFQEKILLKLSTIFLHNISPESIFIITECRNIATVKDTKICKHDFNVKYVNKVVYTYFCFYRVDLFVVDCTIKTKEATTISLEVGTRQIT